VHQCGDVELDHRQVGGQTAFDAKLSMPTNAGVVDQDVNGRAGERVGNGGNTVRVSEVGGHRSSVDPISGAARLASRRETTRPPGAGDGGHRGLG
jgi:hypothetical protein